MRRWRFDSQRDGVLADKGVITAGVVEIQVWARPDHMYFASLRMSPESVHGNAEYIGGLADSRNGAVRKLLDLIYEKPLFDGKVT